MQHVALPDMQLPLNAADEPLARDEHPPVPLLSFCRPKGMIDILMPNTIEGDVFPDEEWYNNKKVAGPRPAAHGKLASGPGDKRIGKAVWRGSVVRECYPLRSGMLHQVVAACQISADQAYMVLLCV